MAKKKEVQMRLPSDVPMLNEFLKKLKQRESKLIADLALKQSPELEGAIIELVGLEVSFRDADQKLLLVEKPELEEGNDELKSEIRFMERRIAVLPESPRKEQLQVALEEKKKGLLSTEVEKNYDKFRSDRNSKLSRLQEAVRRRESEFKQHGTTLEFLLPTVVSVFKKEVIHE